MTAPVELVALAAVMLGDDDAAACALVDMTPERAHEFVGELLILAGIARARFTGVVESPAHAFWRSRE